MHLVRVETISLELASSLSDRDEMVRTIHFSGSMLFTAVCKIIQAVMLPIDSGFLCIGACGTPALIISSSQEATIGWTTAVRLCKTSAAMCSRRLRYITSCDFVLVQMAVVQELGVLGGCSSLSVWHSLFLGDTRTARVVLLRYLPAMEAISKRKFVLAC